MTATSTHQSTVSRSEPASEVASGGRARYRRFDLGQRIEHGVLIVSFTMLSITGLPQKYPDSWWGGPMIAMMGGIEMTRILHHLSAVVLILGSIYHVLSLGYRLWVMRASPSMMPSWKDARDAYDTLRYNFGRRSTPPQMGRYTFGEKIEYWAVIWGTVIMIITGFVLWNPIIVTRFLPGEFIPASKAAHGGEALLAVLSIVTWHVFNVHIKHFNRSMFTGDLSRHVMEEEHALELAAIEEGRETPLVPSPRRRAIYLPLAIVATAVMLVGVYFFLTYEETAITTVPRQPVEVYVPADNPIDP